MADGTAIEWTDATYLFRWDRCGRKGRRCRILARSAVDMRPGERCLGGVAIVTSGNAIRRAERTVR